MYDLIVTGLANKQIAARLAISERTIEVHRSRVMLKMDAGSLSELTLAHFLLTESPSPGFTWA